MPIDSSKVLRLHPHQAAGDREAAGAGARNRRHVRMAGVQEQGPAPRAEGPRELARILALLSRSRPRVQPVLQFLLRHECRRRRALPEGCADRPSPDLEDGRQWQRQRQGGAEADLDGAADPFSMFSELNGRGRWRPGPGAEAKAETRKVFNAERKALQVMGLGPEATLEDVKVEVQGAGEAASPRRQWRRPLDRGSPDRDHQGVQLSEDGGARELARRSGKVPGSSGWAESDTFARRSAHIAGAHARYDPIELTRLRHPSRHNANSAGSAVPCGAAPAHARSSPRRAPPRRSA